MKFVVEVPNEQFNIFSSIVGYLEIDGVVIYDRLGVDTIDSLPVVTSFKFTQLLSNKKTNNYAWWLKYKNGLRVVD